MKSYSWIMVLGLMASAPAFAEIVPNKGGITTGTGRGIIMNSDQRGITTGHGSSITGNGRSGVTMGGANSGVIRMNPSVSLDGPAGTNAVNIKQGGGVKAGVGSSILADGVSGTNAVNPRGVYKPRATGVR